jgi:hypothetical protein
VLHLAEPTAAAAAAAPAVDVLVLLLAVPGGCTVEVKVGCPPPILAANSFKQNYQSLRKMQDLA